jgi:hypothetical protein
MENMVLQLQYTNYPILHLRLNGIYRYDIRVHTEKYIVNFMFLRFAHPSGHPPYANNFAEPSFDLLHTLI